jgi:predicted nuclease with TOPRIM domain
MDNKEKSYEELETTVQVLREENKQLHEENNKLCEEKKDLCLKIDKLQADCNYWRNQFVQLQHYTSNLKN